MKTIKFLGAALMAATLAFVNVSCSSNDDDDEIVLDNTIKLTTVDDAMAIASEALEAPEKTTTPSIITPDAGCSIDKIVVGDGGKAFLYAKVTKAINSDVIVCTYRVEDGKIIINGGSLFGDVVVTTVDNALSIAINGVLFGGTKQDTALPGSVNAVNICRAWSNATYTAGIYVDKLPIYGATASEKQEVSSIVSLKNAIMTKLKKENNMTDEGFKFLEHNIVGINFLNNGKVYITYDNSTVEESSWRWIDESKGKLSTTIDGYDVNVDVRCTKGKPNTAYFIIDANMQGVGNLGVHTLSGRLVCKMKD